ncbi:MAG: 2-C-methyl-D-erythritol 4-phosphate cytidylyltransferase [Gammaproteobacteria bacterium]|nr:MAG: 2-C-methyl-D-erythritol 4-phosphate cytidylyltransferase [Gammaproteobacteria bacterium]
MASTTPIAVIIPAAGFGQRMSSDTAKQFIRVAGKTILAHTVDKIHAWAKGYHHHVIIMVALSEGVRLPADVTGVHTCTGGQERADSVANALDTLADLHPTHPPQWVMVHDAARPLVCIEDIEKLYQHLKNNAIGGILAEKITATVKKVDGDIITATVPRQDLWLAQTPQLFRFELLQQALQGQRSHLTDEASAIEAMGLPVKIIEGSRNNIKITVAEDLHFFSEQIGKY